MVQINWINRPDLSTFSDGRIIQTPSQTVVSLLGARLGHELVTELLSSVYIICPAHTVTTCVHGLRTETPLRHVPLRVQNSAPHPSSCINLICSTLAALSHLKIPVLNVQKASDESNRCRVFSAWAPQEPAPKIYNGNSSVFTDYIFLHARAVMKMMQVCQVG